MNAYKAKATNIITTVVMFVALTSYILFRSYIFSEHRLALCTADYLVMCLEPRFFSIAICPLCLFIFKDITQKMGVNLVVRYKTKVRFCLHQVLEIVKVAGFISISLLILQLLLSLLFTNETVNWHSKVSYYYISTGFTSTVHFIEICVMFLVNCFMGLVFTGTLLLSFRWLCKSHIFGYVVCAICMLLDAAGLPIFYGRLNFINSWTIYSSPFFHFKEIVLIQLGLFVFLSLVVLGKEFYYEK